MFGRDGAPDAPLDAPLRLPAWHPRSATARLGQRRRARRAQRDRTPERLGRLRQAPSDARAAANLGWIRARARGHHVLARRSGWTVTADLLPEDQRELVD